ncbi:energy-coupled thiamine transporter ThiT [Gottschalkiaceae bacterium SANA]|nr:energy-coupled thiamine transporter ThiT [Gottschalkiaceae bacterium SANA]
MKSKSTQMITEAGILIALATVLSLIKISLPINLQGGSITAGSMIPILIFSLRWGLKPGIFMGAVYGIIQMILEPYAMTPIQIFLDYALAFGALGLAGIAKTSFDAMRNGGKAKISLYLAILLGMLGRFAAHFIAGGTVWAIYAPEGQNPWLYSFIYNGSYMLPEILVTFLLLSVLLRPLAKIK